MKKTIAFATRGLIFNGNSLKEKALGGSESAMIYMAKELKKLGNLVYVFCECDSPGEYDGVIYQDIDHLEQKLHFKFDVLILSRFLYLHPKTNISNMTIFWMHDIYSDIYSEYFYLSDKTFLMSEYQKTLWTDIDSRFEDSIYVTKNGFDKSLVKENSFIDKKNNYIYASRPERGLKKLLTSIWPQILEINPEANLFIGTYSIKDMKGLPQEYLDFLEEVEKLVDTTKGVIKAGSLTKDKYYDLLSRCGYMVYPTDFQEISCINAIEAQANKCLVISTNGFALKETVKTNTLANNDEEFIEILKKYQDEVLYTEEVQKGFDSIQEYAWDNIAKDWDSYINTFFKTRFEIEKSRIEETLIWFSDLQTLGSINKKKADVLIQDVEVVNSVQTIEWTETYSTRIAEIIDLTTKAIGNSRAVVLDIGCAEGNLSGNIKKICPNVKVIALDSREDFKEIYLERWGETEFICDSVQNISKYNIQADIILAGEILEHLKDPVNTIRNLNQALRPGGSIIFSTPYGPWTQVSGKREEYCNHFELLDILNIFERYVDNGLFFLQSISSGIFKNELLGNFIFGYTKKLDLEFNNLDKEYLINKAYKVRPREKLSACIIIKNEENNLYRCLNSLKGKVDEIVVIDHESTDHSIEICQNFTDKIYTRKWTDSFMEAKNYALSKCSGDWVFSIDADEELVGDNLYQYIYSSQVDLYTINQRQLDNSIDQDQKPIRLFRKGFSFFGHIHESVKYKDEFKMIINDAFLRHFGYLDYDKAQYEKMQRNHEILLKDIKDHPYREENFMYYMRDMLYFFTVSPNKAYVDLASNTWEYCKNKFTNLEFKGNTETFYNKLLELYKTNHD